MKSNSNVLIWGAIAIAVVIALAGWSLPRVSNVANDPNNSGLFGEIEGVTNYGIVDVTGGYRVDGTEIISGTGGITATSAVFSSTLTTDSAELHSYTSSTSTVLTAQTLVAADIVGYQTVIMSPNEAALTLTWPASSTLSSFLPTAGDWAEQCWVNSTTTAGATITVAAGTGIDLETASSSITDGAAALTILPNSTACIKYIRKPETASAFDIVLQFTRFGDAD